MPWQNNDDSSGSGGPKNPWGDAPPPPRVVPPRRQGAPGNDFEAFIRRTGDKLRGGLNGSGGGGLNGSGGGGLGGGGNNGLGELLGGRNPWLIAVLAAAGLWVAFTSTYRVDAQERGVVLRFGKYVETTGPGFHFKLPAPIDTVVRPKVEQVNSVDIGASDGSAENLMLTGDQNIIDIAYAVRWKIKDPELFLFELAEPEQTIREVAEAAMRAEIGKASLNNAIGPQRAQIAEKVRERMQELLDSYRSGIEIRGVDIKQADPPSAVEDAFKDVSAAQQDAQQYLNQSRAYAQQLLAQAQGATAAFSAVYAQYRLAPEVTRKRMYLETMEAVLGKVDLTVVEPGSVQTYLPLSEIQRRTAKGTEEAAKATSPTPPATPITVQAK